MPENAQQSVAQKMLKGFAPKLVSHTDDVLFAGLRSSLQCNLDGAAGRVLDYSP
ncbi:hypothetical protein [Micromonospora sp. NPDC050200]|uniref:hypothetical protein n=1 Tax=Micromonospora sp. NPDC050200 TaxID=3155664 RepID=UPI0033FABF22